MSERTGRSIRSLSVAKIDAIYQSLFITHVHTRLLPRTPSLSSLSPCIPHNHSQETFGSCLTLREVRSKDGVHFTLAFSSVVVEASLSRAWGVVQINNLILSHAAPAHSLSPSCPHITTRRGV